MPWNYRVVVHADGSVHVHQVGYRGEMPANCTVNPECLSADSVDELREKIAYMQKALDKPVIDMSHFTEQEDKRWSFTS